MTGSAPSPPAPPPDADDVPTQADLGRPSTEEVSAPVPGKPHETEPVSAPLPAGAVAGEVAAVQVAPTAWAPPPGTPSREAAADVPERLRQIGRFTVVSVLGKGGMGMVLRARDPELRRDVAIKVLLPGCDSPDERARFEREGRASARLRHPHIVGVLEVGSHEGSPYLVMDFVDGESLAQRLRDESVPPRQVAHWIQQIAEGLAHAHDAGVIHRDLKPANVLIDRTGCALLVDFGLVRDVDASEQLTATGEVLGTLSYMSPEQAGLGEWEISQRTDVHALGATLYRALTGRPPFLGGGTIDVLKAVIFDQPPRPRRLDPSIHPDLETITMRCLEKDPARRYPSAEAVAAELGRWLRGEAIHARPPGPVRWVLGYARRRPWRVATALLAVTAVLALAAIPLRQASLRGQERRQAQAEALGVAAEEATAAVAALESARAASDVEENAEAARHDQLLGLSMDVMAATARHAALAGEDSDAWQQAFDAALAVGEVASQARQWSVAAAAIARAQRMGVDDDRAQAAAAALEEARTALARAHWQAVEAELDRARSGELSKDGLAFQEALFTIVGYREAQTVTVLVAALDELSAKLEASGGARLAGADWDLARLCCEALGWLRLRGPAVLALGRYLAAQPDEIQAVPAGLALCLLGGEEAERLVVEARGRFGNSSSFWRQVKRAYGRTGVEPVLGGETAVELNRRGLLRSYKGDLEGAIADFNRAIGLDPRLGNAWSNRGSARQEKGDLEGAIADFSRAIEIDPKHAIPWNNRGEARRVKGDIDGAITDFTRALELDPNLSETWSNRGLAREDKGDMVGAIADHTRALEIDPNLAAAWNNRGHARAASGNLVGAIADYTRALEIAPYFMEVWYNRGEARQAKGDLEGAIADYGRALEIDPNFVATWNIRGIARKVNGDLDGAIADFSRALELDPDQSSIWINRGDARAQKGHLDAGIADMTKAIDIDGLSALAWSTRGRFRGMKGDYDGATADCSRAIEIDSNCAMAWNGRGTARAAKGDLDGAMTDWTRAIEADPRYATAWRNRGLAWQAKGDLARARADLERFLELKPTGQEAAQAREALRAIAADQDQ